MTALSLLIIGGGVLAFRFNRGIGDMRKSMDEEWGLTVTQASGYAFLAKVAGVGLVIAGAVMFIFQIFKK